MTAASAQSVPAWMIAKAGYESHNALRDALFDLGHEREALGCERHTITSLDHAQELLDGAYGWEQADQSSDLASIRSLITILDRYSNPTDDDLLRLL